MDSTKRIRWIDVAKGLCMFFIVLGHVCKANYRTDPLRIFCYSFNAQAFFFLSGYTFMGVTTLTKGKFLNINVRAYILKWIDRVLYPYFVWGTISIFIFFLMGKFGIIDEDTRLLPNFIGLLFGNSTSSYFQWNRPLWFLPCIFLSYLMLLFVVAFYYKNHDSKKIIAFFFALFTFIITVATLMTRINITYINIWHWETAFVLFPLMGGGFLFKQYQPFALCRMGGHMRKVIFAFIFFLFAAILGSTTVFTDLRQNVLAGYFRFMVVSTLLTSAVVLISMEIEHSKVLEWVGSHSLQILVLHKFPVLFFQSLCPYIKELISAGNIIAEFVVVLLTIGISGACIAVIEKYIPWLFVRKRSLNEKNKLY